MEHGQFVDSSFPLATQPQEPSCDYNSLRHVGWHRTDNEFTKTLFSKRNIDLISRKVTELTMGVDPDNRPITVPDENICWVLDSVYTGYTPVIGGIYTKDIMPLTGNYQGTGLLPDDYIRDMIDQTIEGIVSQVRNLFGTIQNNAKLTVWTTVLGDFNEHGLRSHSQIKVRNRKPQAMAFNMNY